MTPNRAKLFETLSSYWCNNKKQCKYAILIGPSYDQFTFKLNSSQNDINSITNLLTNLMDYKKENIFLLNNQTISPTKINIINKFKEIVNRLKPGDYLFFYFTGHGMKNGLLTEDKKLILNYELKKIIDLFPININFFSLIDCCCSDNKFKLPYYYLKNWFAVKKYNKNNQKYFSLSACTKKESTTEIKMKNDYHSFITNLFVDFLTVNPKITWGELLNYINFTILVYDYKQHPLISSSFIFDLKSPVYF